MTLKKQNQPKPKNITTIRSASLSKKKEKKHIGKTPLIKTNSLISISIILVARIVIDGNFLSLYRNMTSLCLFSHEKELRNKENKVWY